MELDKETFRLSTPGYSAAMCRFLLGTLLCLNIVNNNLLAQTFDVDFFHTFDKTAGVEQSHAARDSANGNLAFAHFYRGQIDIGIDTTIIHTAPNPNFNYLLITQFDANYTLDWMVEFYSTDEILVKGVTYDGKGSVIISGNFYDSLNVGTSTDDWRVKAANHSWLSGFIIKLDLDGQLIYAKTFDASGGVIAFYTPTANASGDVALSMLIIGDQGYFHGDTINYLAGNTSVSTQNYATVSISDSGDVNWLIFPEIVINRFPLINKYFHSAIDNDGNVFLTGQFNGASVAYTNYLNDPINISAEVFEEVSFVLKLNSAGKMMWFNVLFTDNVATHFKTNDIVILPNGNPLLLSTFYYNTTTVLNETNFTQGLDTLFPLRRLQDVRIVTEVNKSVGGIERTTFFEKSSASVNASTVNFFYKTESISLDDNQNIVITGLVDHAIDVIPGGDSTLFMSAKTSIGQGGGVTFGNAIFLIMMDSSFSPIFGRVFGERGRAYYVESFSVDDDLILFGHYRGEPNIDLRGDTIFLPSPPSQNVFDKSSFLVKYSLCNGENGIYPLNDTSVCHPTPVFFNGLNRFSGNHSKVYKKSASCGDSIVTLTIYSSGSLLPHIQLQNDSILIAQASRTPDSCSWYRCVNGVLDPIQSNGECELPADSSGFFAVRIYKDGCDALSNCSYFNISLFNKMVNDKVSFSVYPNPASQHVYIDLSSPLSKSGYIYIYDLSGRKVMEQKIAIGETEFILDVQPIISGTYILRITEGEIGIAQMKLLIVKN